MIQSLFQWLDHVVTLLLIPIVVICVAIAAGIVDDWMRRD